MNKLCKLQRNWYVIDAKNKILGRLSSFIIRYLVGKHKVEYAPHIDNGDYVIVINSKEIIVSGKKYKNKIYYHYTGYVGGLKKRSFKNMVDRSPNRIIEIAVKGMLPKNNLGHIMYRRLRVYSGEMHIHTAQMPKFLDSFK